MLHWKCSCKLSRSRFKVGSYISRASLMQSETMCLQFKFVIHLRSVQRYMTKLTSERITFHPFAWIVLSTYWPFYPIFAEGRASPNEDGHCCPICRCHLPIQEVTSHLAKEMHELKTIVHMTNRHSAEDRIVPSKSRYEVICI